MYVSQFRGSHTCHPAITKRLGVRPALIFPKLRMRRSSVSIVQSNGLQLEIRSPRSLEIQEIMVPNIVVDMVAVVLLSRGRG